MIVTAEPYFSVSQPSDVVVMENFLRKDTSGTLETVDAKYELLRRGQYTLNISGGQLAPIASDIKVPLQLREAREAIAIAKAQGADKYSPDVMAKVAINMKNAEGYYSSHNDKELETVAREATQQAEDARRISIVKEREQAEQAAKEAQDRREADAKQRATLATAEAAEQTRLRAAADADRADAERQKKEAQIAMANAREAQQQAEAARLAALAEQKRLADQAASSQAAREAAERDTQAMREKLKEQLNTILQTRDTARGLIVNLSDVLFGFNQATLKPETKEKLAKMSGILLAYPTLHVNVEGHTDSIGSDDYNLKLSQRRADAVRDYLTSNGINPGNIQAIGLGKAAPVASNDNAAGRQQNRRVEMVMSGDIIGQPIDNAPESSRVR
jgi:outer membrane protein OmpA-like peptidoglycan-associated protein